MITPSPTNTAALLGLDRNGIGWCTDTLNPGLFGCAYTSPACGTADRTSQCYAEAMAARLVKMGTRPDGTMTATAARYAEGLRDGRWTGRVSVHPEMIAPAFAKLPRKPGSKIRRVFVTSMSDLFHKDVPFDFIDAVFEEMIARWWFVYQATTKRAERAAEYAADRRRRGLSWPAHVWLIVTVENQEQANKRIPAALTCGAAVVGLSVEPMLGPIRLHQYIRLHRPVGADVVWLGEHKYTTLDGAPPSVASRGVHRVHLNPYGARSVDPGDGRMLGIKPGECEDLGLGVKWVIIGCESDGNRPGARETNGEDVLDLVDQCDAAGTAVFVKQIAIDGRLCSLPMVNGKVRAEFPEVPRG